VAASITCNASPAPFAGLTIVDALKKLPALK
jgi:hypothetical protein